MKKSIISVLLVLVMLFGMLPTAAFAADSVEEALGEIDIYNGGVTMSYLSINGRNRELIYTYYNYIDRNGQTREIPAYCVNPNITGVPQSVPEGESIKYIAEQRGSDPKVVGIVANGYPTRGLQELGLENKYHAYYATKMALWCYLLSNWDINNLKVNPSLTGVELQRANQILAAAKDIYRRGTSWTKVLTPGIVSEADQDVAYPVTVDGQDYYQQVFTVTSETWVCDYIINVAFSDPSAVPEGTKIVDMNNREISQIITEGTGNGYAGKFKVLYPAESIEGESGSVQLSFKTNVYKYGVYYAVCAETDQYGNLQNYMVDTDPTIPLNLTAYSTYTSDPEQDTPETSLKIIKLESGTEIPLRGAVFEVVDPEGATIGTFATDSRGEIVIPLYLAGNYTVYERSAPQGYLLSEEPAQNVTVLYGEQATLTFENDPYGALEVRKYSNTGMALNGAVIQIEHIETGAKYTQETGSAGVAIFDELQPGAYRITEIESPDGYLKDDTVYTQTVVPGDTVIVPIVNEEKPGLRILKYDSMTQEALPDITFEIFKDTQSLGQYTTDQFGEILLTDLDPGTYLVKEIATDESHIVNSTPQQIELEGGDGILQLIFFNEQKPGIHLVKLDATSLEPLPNATFRIEHVGGTFSKEYVTDENGEVDLTNLEPGAYLVTELSAPDGYLIDDATRVIQINGNENAEFVFTNTKQPSFRLVKLDSFTGEGLGGCTFRIARIADGTHYLDRVTDSNGEINISDLEPGVYSVQETKAAEGYVIDPTEYHVELFPGQTSELVVSNDRKPNLEIIKTDAVTGAPVEGVTFTVKRVDSSTLTTVKSDAEGKALIEKLDPGVYEVWEQSVPDNYLLNEEHQLITLEPNRTGTVHFQNYPKPGLTILKVDSITGDTIKGAKFQITYASNDTFEGEINDLGTYYTDESGQIKLDNLRDGWYRVTELEPAAGYAIKDPATQECYIKAGTQKTLTFENTPLSAIVIKKVDADTGAPLEGAWFRVRFLAGTSGTGGTVVAERQTSSNGTIVLTGLEAGTYVIEEISAPDGYVINDSAQTVYLSGEDQAAITVVFGNDKMGSLLITKKDAVTGEPISDVEFLVTNSDGGVIGNANGKFVTDSAGTIRIDGLEPGSTVIVKETRAKDGYLLDDTPQSIKIKANETMTLEFRNQPLGGLIIHKLDSITKEPLEGAQFKITYANGSFVDAEGGKLSSNGLYTTDKNGQITISGITGTLVVTEVQAPDGYIIDETTRSQTVVVRPDDTQTLTFYNTPSGGLQIIKSDEDTGARISGVEFEVRKMNGEIIGAYTTDRNGVISLPEAESGWYQVTELKAADGYQLDDTPAYVCVKDGETATLEITNQRMSSIMIHKIDADTRKGIYGVKFILYDAGKNPVGEYVTDQDGYIWIDDELVPGKYYLRELEAAEGYVLDEEYKTVYVERGHCAQITWENTAVTGQIQVRKYAEEANTITGAPAGAALEGAVYEITQARSGMVVGYITTDAHGVAASDPLPLGRYYVTEVSAPAYYQINSEKMEAEIEYPGQIIKLSQYDKPANLGVTIKKTGNYEVQPGTTMWYDFSGIANTSNVALNNFYWHDRLPTDATNAMSLTTGTYNQRLYYRITFKTNVNDYRVLASNLLTTNNYSVKLSAAALGLVQGEYVTDVRFEFGTVASGFSSVTNPSIQVQVKGTVANGYQIINRSDVGGQYLNEWQTAMSNWVTIVRRFQPVTPLPKTGY